MTNDRSTGSGGWDELVADAQQRLADQEAAEQRPSELGDSVDLDQGESFRGRWRGQTETLTRYGVSDVFLLWDEDGRQRFMWPKALLRREIEEQQPQRGDLVAIVRGQDIPSSDPDRNPTQRFAVSVQPSTDPLPDSTATDDGIPFLCPGEQGPRSAHSAAAATASA